MSPQIQTCSHRSPAIASSASQRNRPDTSAPLILSVSPPLPLMPRRPPPGYLLPPNLRNLRMFSLSYSTENQRAQASPHLHQNTTFLLKTARKCKKWHKTARSQNPLSHPQKPTPDIHPTILDPLAEFKKTPPMTLKPVFDHKSLFCTNLP